MNEDEFMAALKTNRRFTSDMEEYFVAYYNDLADRGLSSDINPNLVPTFIDIYKDGIVSTQDVVVQNGVDLGSDKVRSTSSRKRLRKLVDENVL
jgi:hypothetical protein